MNQELGRVEVEFAFNQVTQAVRGEIMKALDVLAEFDSGDGRLISDIHCAITRDKPRSYEVGIVARRFVEHVVDGMLSPQSTKDVNLMRKIESLSNLKVAPWVVSYMHLIRIVGNEGAHERARDRTPPHLIGSDLSMCLFALLRILEFWNARPKPLH